MIQTVGAVKSQGGLDAGLALKPESQFLNWDLYCLNFVGVLEMLCIQNLELLGGKGKDKSPAQKHSSFVSGSKAHNECKSYLLHPRPSHPVNEAFLWMKTPLDSEIMATLCWVWTLPQLVQDSDLKWVLSIEHE